MTTPATSPTSPTSHDATALDIAAMIEHIRRGIDKAAEHGRTIRDLEKNKPGLLFDYTDEDRTYRLAILDLAAVKDKLADYVPSLLAHIDELTAIVNAQIDSFATKCHENDALLDALTAANARIAELEAKLWTPGEIKATRCPICNGLLRRIGPDSYSHDVWKCDDCESLFSSGVGGTNPVAAQPSATRSETTGVPSDTEWNAHLPHPDGWINPLPHALNVSGRTVHGGPVMIRGDGLDFDGKPAPAPTVATKTTTFAVGDRVKHREVYGTFGTVINVEPDSDWISVKYDNGKTVMWWFKGVTTLVSAADTRTDGGS